MKDNKIIDCITFFDNNFMFDIRYNILSNYVDYFVVCESMFDHAGNLKKKNFIFEKHYDPNKIKYIFLDEPFPKNTDRWQNQAIQRDFILNKLDFVEPEDYIFFSDPDEIIKPEILNNFNLSAKYGIFLHDCFNYKFNLYNPHESPWEGTRVAKKKNLKSLDFLRQKILRKNLRYKFYRIDKEKDIQVFKNAGWHFNNIMPVKQISLKLRTFAHSEFSSKKFSSTVIIQQKIKKKIDLFNRGHKYKKVKFDKRFPNFILLNKKKFRKFIL